MSEIKKKELTRGVKLTKDHVWDNNLDQVITNLNSANIIGADAMISSQYDKDSSTFSITWVIPKLTSRWTRVNGPNRLKVTDFTTTPPTRAVEEEGTQPYIIPFVLPPFQELINFTSFTDHTMPQVYLTEFSYGFDQRTEPGLPTSSECGPGSTPTPTAPGLQSQTWGQYSRAKNQGATSKTPVHDATVEIVNPNHGKIHYDIATRGPLKFAITSKEPTYYNADAGMETNDYHWDLEVPMAGFIGEKFRVNPAAQKNINLLVDPYRTYLMEITPPQLHDTDISPSSDQNNLALVNLTIKLTFRMRLMNRDPQVAVTAPPGIPSEQFGQKTQTTYTVTKPAAATTITADDATGLNTTTTTIDQVFKDKLRSGYDTFSQTPPKEELCQDAGYDIIAIPMWNNQYNNVTTIRSGVLAKQMFHCGGALAPPVQSIADDDGPMQRAIIPIDYPFAIHHVFLAMNSYTANYMSNGSSGLGPAPNTFEMVMDAWDQTKGQGAYPANRIGLGKSDLQPFHEIGVGVGTGRQATQYGYKQVLHHQNLRLNDKNASAFLYDKIKKPYPFSTEELFPSPEPNWHIYNLPLNGIAGAGAGTSKGFFDTTGAAVGSYAGMIIAQDPAYFCGNSWVSRAEATQGTQPMTIDSVTGTGLRRVGPTGVTEEFGHDQWIEIRWKYVLKTASGIARDWSAADGEYSNTTSNLTEGNGGKVINGVGGSWIYLIVKKTEVSNANFKNTYLKGGM